MRVIDTSAWIEWLIGSRAGKKIGGLLPEPDAWVVPTIVQLELAKWLTREIGEDKADQVIAFSETCQIAPLDTKIALAAAELCRVRKLATADAIVLATALHHGAELISCDADFENMPEVTYVPKSAG